MISMSNIKGKYGMDKQLVAGDATYFNFTQDNNSAFNATGASASTGMFQPTITNDLRIKLSNGSFIETFDNFNGLSSTDCSNILNEYNKIRISYNIYSGNGADGNITVTGTKNINTDVISSKRSKADAICFNVINLTSTTARLSITPSTGDLTAGDEILLMNIQGTTSNYANVGNYETLRIKSISGDTITFTTVKVNKYGSGSGDDLNIGTSTATQRVILQRVPNYNNVYIDTGNTLTANAQDGTKGGILFFRAAGTVTINGTISMNSKGFRAGSGGEQWGTDGESYGGQGGNLGNGRQGGNGNPGAFPGSGAGHYSTGSGGNPYPGGNTYGIANLSKVYLGSGGGGGNRGYAGGLGGGAIVIAANNLILNGYISANGGNGTTGTSGGGNGSGGSIKMSIFNYTSYTNYNTVTPGTCGGYSAGASYGRVAIYYKYIDGTITPASYIYSLQTTPVNTSNKIQSINVLNSHIVNSIQRINYRLERNPSGCETKIQFSQDQSNQYNANGTLNSYTLLTTDKTTISTPGLNSQSGSNFYYKIDMSSDGNDSPVLDQIEVEYDPDTYESTEQQQKSHIMDSIVGARIRSLCASQMLDQSDQINPKFQILASNTGLFTGEETIFPAGAGSYYQNGGTYFIDNNIDLNVQGQVGYDFYRYWRIYVYLDAGNVTTDAPVLKSVGFQGILRTSQSQQLIGDTTAQMGTLITKNTSVKVLEKSITISELKTLTIIGEMEIDNTGYDAPNGTTTNMQIARDGTQLHEKLETTHLQKNQYQKYIVDNPPIGTVKYQIYISEAQNKCDSVVVRGNIRILT